MEVYHQSAQHRAANSIRTESNTILRKIFEAYFIYNQKPEINDKSEIKILQRFLVNGDVIHSD